MNNILAALLAFDTTSRHSNLAMIDWIADFLAARGVASRRFYDPSGGKANLYARLGPSGGGGVMLSGHTTWSRWTARPGAFRLSASPSAMAATMAAAAPI